MLISLLEIIIIIIPILISIAYITIGERKIMGSMQRRIGPNKIGLFGLLQPFADALKLIFKENINPAQSNKNLLLLAPTISLILILFG
jgi:NADH:ubiquinone oxidoreductase subunit H